MNTEHNTQHRVQHNLASKQGSKQTKINLYVFIETEAKTMFNSH